MNFVCGLSPNSDRKVSKVQLDCVAIVWTELQQVMLTAIVLQEGWQLSIVFVRDGIRLLDVVKKPGTRIVRVPNLSYSVHQIKDYRRVVLGTIRSSLAEVGEYRFLTWTLESPLAKGIASRPECKSISFFEDGAGSYLYMGRFGWRNGLKYLVTKLLINLALWHGRNLISTPAEKSAEFWSLFPNPVSGKAIRRRVLSHESFRSAMLAASLTEHSVHALSKGSVLYLPSPFADCNLMTDAEEIEIHVDALRRFFDYERKPVEALLWKSHPRAIPYREHARIDAIRKQLSVEIEVVPTDLNIEQILLSNQDIELSIVSVFSSAIYTLEALGINRHKVVCIDSRLLRAHRPELKNLYHFFHQIGVQVI